MHKIAFVLFISTLIFSPLAFGTTEQWSMATVQLLVCCTALSLVFATRNNEKILLKVPGMLPLVLFVLWMVFQIVPLPATVVQIVSSSSYDVYKPIHEVSGQNQWVSLTVNQKASLFELMRVATYVLFYFLTVQILSNSERLKKTIRIVTYLAIGIAFLAIIQKFSSPDKIYWFRSTPANAGTVGPWVYHNHYAGFMEMMFPLVFALFLFYRPVIDREKTLRSRVAAVFTMPSSNLHFFLGFGAIVIVSSVFISLSRGGLISLILALVFFLAILPRRIIKFRFVTYGVLASCIALAITWFGWGALLDKFGTSFTETSGIYDIRLMLWQDSIRIVRDFFLTGTGSGTFIFIYPLYKTLSTDFILHHAHNDYIEILTDYGIVGFLLAAWFIVSVIYHGWKKITYRRDKYAVLLSIGALSGIVSILFHSITDFNMYNGANGLYFFFLCGLLISAGNTRLYYRTKPTLLGKAGASTKSILIVFSLILLAAIYVRGGAIYASNLYSKVANIYLSKRLHKEKVLNVSLTAARASRFDPMEGKYPFALGTAQIFLNQPEDAIESFLRASKKDPLSGMYLQRLALILTTVDKGAAEKLMPIAYTRALNKESFVLTWAEWLLSINEREKAIEVLQEILADNPQFVQKFISAFHVYSFNRQEISSMLPESVDAWARLGRFAALQGNLDDAEFYMTRALDFLDRGEVILPWYFRQLYWLYYNQKKYDKALGVLREGSKRLPKYAQFHIYLGDYYRREGIIYRAKEEYEQALLLEPADEKTRKKLEELEKK